MQTYSRGPKLAGRASIVQHSCIMISRKAEPIDVLLHNPRMEFRIATSSKAMATFESNKHLTRMISSTFDIIFQMIFY